MKKAINILDYGYKMHEVCEIFNIPTSTLRDHYNGRIKGKKMLAHLLTFNDFKLKVVEMTFLKGHGYIGSKRHF